MAVWDFNRIFAANISLLYLRSIMSPDARKEYIERVLYIVNRQEGIDIYHLFKIMYFAQREFLRKYGMTIFPDKFVAMKYGPVPRMLYDALCPQQFIKEKGGTPIDEDVRAAMHRLEEGDVSNVVVPRRKPDMDYISPAASRTLDHAMVEYGQKTFRSIMDESHTALWQKTFSRKPGSEMKQYDIAADANASEDVLAYIRENQLFEEAFR